MYTVQIKRRYQRSLFQSLNVQSSSTLTLLSLICKSGHHLKSLGCPIGLKCQEKMRWDNSCVKSVKSNKETVSSYTWHMLSLKFNINGNFLFSSGFDVGVGVDVGINVGIGVGVDVGIGVGIDVGIAKI